jgi:hypothetical protein
MSLSDPWSGHAGVGLLLRLRNTLRSLGLLPDPGAWIDPAGSVLICAYPRDRRALARLQRLGIRRLVNLHGRRHAPGRLLGYALTESHVPVADFEAPTRPQLEAALAVIHAAVSAGERLAVHCGGGLGRSGTVAACSGRPRPELGQRGRAGPGSAAWCDRNAGATGQHSAVCRI